MSGSSVTNVSHKIINGKRSETPIAKLDRSVLQIHARNTCGHIVPRKSARALSSD
jgi:hypothetical protein